MTANITYVITNDIEKERFKMTVQDILTVEEVADVLRVTRNTVQRKKWRDQTGCPLFKQGKRLFSYRIEFERWYKNRVRYV